MVFMITVRAPYPKQKAFCYFSSVFTNYPFLFMHGIELGVL